MKHIVIGFLLGAITMYIGVQTNSNTQPTAQENIASYYAHSAATLVSPHNIRERMTNGKGDYILVDVRAQEDYLRGHIVTAVNIDTGRDLAVVLEEFKTLVAENPDKEIIVYCYSAACMNGRKAGNFLAQNGLFVKEMTIGWNEWRYGWEMWNYDTEWEEVKVEEYVVEGAEPGEVSDAVKTIKPCGVAGELSC